MSTQNVNSNVNTTENTEKKEPVRINVETPLPFDSNIKSCFMNTIELAEIVDSLFGDSMRDYVGCKISLNNGDVPQHIAMEIPMGKLYVTLYFKDCSKTSTAPIANVTSRSVGSGNTNKFASLMKMSGTNAGRMYEITKETYEALDPFRFFPNRKANWNYLTNEIVTNFGFNTAYNQEIVACITGLDLEKMINMVYGSRTDEGIFQYQANPVQIVANASGEYVVQITQLDVQKLEDLRRSLGGPIARTEFHPYNR